MTQRISLLRDRLTGRLTDRLLVLRLLPLAGPWGAGGLALLHLLLGVLPVSFVLANSKVLGEVQSAAADGNSGAWSGVAAAFLVAGAVFVLQQLLAPLAVCIGDHLARRVDGQVFHALMLAAMSSPGIAPLEDQRVLGSLKVAAGELESGVQSPGQAASGLLALIARYTQLAGYVLLVGLLFSWPGAVLLFSAVLVFRHGQSGGMRRYARERRDLEGAERETDYLRRLAVQDRAGKEIRVFGLVDWLSARLERTTRAFLSTMWAARRRVYLMPFVRYTAYGLAVMAGVLALLGARAADQLSLAAFAVVVQCAVAAVRLGEYYPESDLQLATGVEAYRALGRFRADLAVAAPAGETLPGRAHRGAVTVPEPRGTIRFENVTFAYPGRSRPVFEDLDLTLTIGRSTALVGVNGAGKTTLIKLLTRLYEPTRGRITLDGTDIRAFPVDAWRARLGVVFQDYLRHEATARENIAFGANEHAGDEDGIRAAVTAVGLDTMLAALPGGLDTPLARHMSGGTDLSGGQWQRLALARVLFALRHGARVLVLDEPTASLDVRAEAGFYQEFARLTAGATSLLISHRFATVRHTDQIVVLEQGRVLEQGSHEVLMRLGGRYAELFTLQAESLMGTADTTDTTDTTDTADTTVAEAAL
ncbi:ABC transporter ATP-binding protein [Streptomyces sp. NPDC088387]|uniref:ABC transporter ATP-binding protein n=1 Tax=Streptomyces sp. NPDC088387 TaxID=3365859 RepID=UPI0037F9E07F